MTKILPLFRFCLPFSFSLLLFSYSVATGHEISRENAVVRAVRKVSPAVVNISSQTVIRQRANPFSGFGMDPFFDSFFKDFFDPDRERQYQRSSLGSGVIIDGKRGFILTNAHVLSKSGRIAVILNDEREFEAAIVGADPDSDLAVLRIKSSETLPSMEMGNSDDLMIGETVIAIGNPFGFANTVTTGVISAENRSIRTDDRIYHNFIQIDASINPGNSGGPLLNIQGELIGINTAIYAKAQGIGFAIPINKAKRIISDLIRYGEVVPVWIGLTVQNVDARLAGYLKIPAGSGVMVKAIEPESPAQKAGFKEGDIILAVGNHKIASATDYALVLRGYGDGSVLNFNVMRSGRQKSVSVKGAHFPLSRALDLTDHLLGIKIKDLNKQNRLKYRSSAREGALITALRPQAYLAQIGVQPGDVIRRLDEHVIATVADFKKAIIKVRQKSSLVILIQRGDQGYYITVKL